MFSFDGRVVDKLPFLPIGLLQNLSHRNLVGDDFYDCSFIFVYIHYRTDAPNIVLMAKCLWEMMYNNLHIYIIILRNRVGPHVYSRTD